MSTRTIKAGEQLKASINQTQSTIEHISSKREQAIEAIQGFIDVSGRYPYRNHGNHALFALHVLFREDIGDGTAKYKHHRIEDMKIIINALRNFFINPEHAAAFNNTSYITSDMLAGCLSGLHDFFETMMEPECEAVLEQYDLEQYGRDKTEKDLMQVIIRYNRDAEVEAAKNEIMDRHNQQLQKYY